MSCDEKILHIIGFVVMIVLSSMHFVFYFFFKVTDLSGLFDTFESSPIFDFYIDNEGCGAKEYIIFHIWEGVEEIDLFDEIDPKTEINRINGYFFCYRKKMSYKELLYNNQIIKKNEMCRKEYKNCGIIDTLEQNLCMPKDEECPLYDVEILEENKNNNYESNPFYIYNENASISYNNNNYNEPNKKIIGQLLLSEGQPCININEKLWRKFISKEIADSHLKCEYQIFGKATDDRYVKKGGITYYDLYKSILDSKYLNLFSTNELSTKYVSLYKREFLGIDKACDEKLQLSQENLDKLKASQKSEKILLLVEPILAIFIALLAICAYFGGGGDEAFKCFIIFYSLLFVSCIICHIVFFARIIYYDFSNYECSDKITNEIIRIENLNTKKTILFTAINLGADLIIIIFNVFPFLYPKCEDCCDNCHLNLCEKCCNFIKDKICKKKKSKENVTSKKGIRKTVYTEKTRNKIGNKIKVNNNGNNNIKREENSDKVNNYDKNDINIVNNSNRDEPPPAYEMVTSNTKI